MCVCMCVCEVGGGKCEAVWCVRFKCSSVVWCKCEVCVCVCCEVCICVGGRCELCDEGGVRWCGVVCKCEVVRW